MLSLDGKPIENGRQLQVNLYRRAVGESVMLEIARHGEVSKAKVAIVERFSPEAGAAVDPRDHVIPRLGILAVNLDQRIARMIPVLRVSSGVVVASAVNGGIDTRDGGLLAGDVIYAVNQTRVTEIDSLRRMLNELNAGDPAVLHIERRGALMFLAFIVE